MKCVGSSRGHFIELMEDHKRKIDKLEILVMAVLVSKKATLQHGNTCVSNKHHSLPLLIITTQTEYVES